MAPKSRNRGGRAPNPLANGITESDKKRAPPKSKESVVKKPQAQRKRPIQPRVAKALRNAAEQAPAEPQTAIPALPSVPAYSPDQPKVTRINNLTSQTTPASLFFARYCWLNTSPDTEIIALNLLDHFVQPHHALPQLWYGRLHAVSFLLACKLTGVENSIQAVAEAVETITSGFPVSLWSSALKVPVEDVRVGMKAVLGRKEQIAGLVGQYADVLEILNAEENIAGVEEHASREEAVHRVSEDGGEAIDLDADLFDFDTYQEPGEDT